MIFIFDYYGVIYNPIDQASSDVFNRPLLSFIATELKTYPTYIFTSGSVSTQAQAELGTATFTGIYTIRDIGKPKTDPQAYQVLASKLEVSASEIVFVDDQHKNIQAAQKTGVQGVNFQGTQALISQLRYLHQPS